MNAATFTHPSEDDLLQYATEGTRPELTGHISQCATCFAFVNDLDRIKKSIASLGDEEVPDHVKQRIHSIVDQRSSGLWRLVRDWRVMGQFVLALLVIGFIVAAYLLYVYLG